MTEAHLLVDIADGVARLTMNRPDKRNALSPEMLVRMSRAWRQIRDDDAIRVVVLTGSCDKAFCAGADLGRLITLMTRQRGPEDLWDEELLADSLLRGFVLDKPVISAIVGDALAGGTELMLATDSTYTGRPKPSSTDGLRQVLRESDDGRWRRIRPSFMTIPCAICFPKVHERYRYQSSSSEVRAVSWSAQKPCASSSTRSRDHDTSTWPMLATWSSAIRTITSPPPSSTSSTRSLGPSHAPGGRTVGPPRGLLGQRVVALA